MVWGFMIVCSSVFRLKKEDYSNQRILGASGFLEMEFMVKAIGQLPWRCMKAFTVMVGLSFIVVGGILI